jgi:hypothetical protein
VRAALLDGAATVCERRDPPGERLYFEAVRARELADRVADNNRIEAPFTV